MRPDLEKTRIMTTIVNSVRATMAGAMKEAMKIPEVQVNVLRANGLTSFLSSLRGWVVPLGMIAGASAAPGGGAPLRARVGRRARLATPRARARARTAVRRRFRSAAGWMVYPALTTDFKVNTLGIEKAPPSGQTYEFEKEAVGENPELTAGNVKG